MTYRRLSVTPALSLKIPVGDLEPRQDFRGSQTAPAQLAGSCLEMPRPRGQHHHGGELVEPRCLRLPS